MNRDGFGNDPDDDDDFETVRVSKSSPAPAVSSAAKAGCSGGSSRVGEQFTRRASQSSQNNSQEIVRTSDLQKAKNSTQGINKKTGISLLARAVNLLSRREHSELELSRKLLPHAASPEEIEQVLARLKKENWQSNQRFTHTFAQQKSSKWGTAKILQELKQHKLDPEDISALKEQLEQSEFERAYEVWDKKFRGQAYSTPQEYAKQIRFLLSRGFNADVVRKIVGGQYPDEF